VTVQELIIELVKGCPMEAEVHVEVWPHPEAPGGGEIVACEINQVTFLASEGRATLQIWLPPDADLPRQAGEETP
jgi:hypothetical protein